MKVTNIHFPSRKIIFGLFSIALISMFTACSNKITFLNSSVVPAARGSVNIKKDHNKNYLIQIDITGLAEVERLPAPNHTYVVWMETDEGFVKNIGQIKSSMEGLFSKNLKADFETVTSFKPEKIFITAEDNADTQFPNTQIILTTKY